MSNIPPTNPLIEPGDENVLSLTVNSAGWHLMKSFGQFV